MPVEPLSDSLLQLLLGHLVSLHGMIGVSEFLLSAASLMSLPGGGL